MTEILLTVIIILLIINIVIALTKNNRLQTERLEGLLREEMKEVETELGKAMVKICSYKGMKKAYPEYDCVRQLAKEHHKTFDQTFRIVKAAAEQLL